MKTDSNLQLAKEEAFQAIIYFVQRQVLVAQALKDVGLDLSAIAMLGAGGWTIGFEGAKELYERFPQNLEGNFRNALRRMIDHKTPKADQTGNWQDKDGETWAYFMHGGGCRLSNLITGEVIDWDCPDTDYFDSFKFAFHLKWQIQKFPDKYPFLTRFVSNIDIHAAVENHLIPELVNEGKLTKDLTNRYRVS